EGQMDKRKEMSDRITQLVDSLPLFPTDIDGLLSAAVKPSEDGVELLRLIESDPKLSGELLKLSRSYFGGAEEFETVRDVVNQVGLQPLVQLIGISYAKSAIQEEFAALKYLNEYVDHAEEISIGCRIIAEITDLPRSECEIYALAGLVHDVGRLAILAGSNRTSAHVLGTLWDKMASIVHDEKASLGTNHCEVGTRICKKWNLSPVIQEGVSRHHTPLIDGDFNFVGALVFISHFLSYSDPSGDIISTALPGELFERLNLSHADFEKAKKVYQSRTQHNS
ncbi:MAG: HDOD domain-containing protein, partial [Sedimentisphaerales bacterium]|nr:HDOD domain-containing protein [Sedimentisphaerales bacterium]